MLSPLSSPIDSPRNNSTIRVPTINEQTIEVAIKTHEMLALENLFHNSSYVPPNNVSIGAF